jgi:hypothetical protein
MSLPSAIIVRRAAFARTEQVAYQQIPPLYVQITDITSDARTAWRKTWEGRHPSGYGEFPWERLWFRHCRYSAEAFQMAIWSHETLCGLAIGTIPKARRRLTLRYMEAKPIRILCAERSWGSLPSRRSIIRPGSICRSWNYRTRRQAWSPGIRLMASPLRIRKGTHDTW